MTNFVVHWSSAQQFAVDHALTVINYRLFWRELEGFVEPPEPDPLNIYLYMMYMGLNHVYEDAQGSIKQTGDFHMTCIIKVANIATFS